MKLKRNERHVWERTNGRERETERETAREREREIEGEKEKQSENRRKRERERERERYTQAHGCAHTEGECVYVCVKYILMISSRHFFLPSPFSFLLSPLPFLSPSFLLSFRLLSNFSHLQLFRLLANLKMWMERWFHRACLPL